MGKNKLAKWAEMEGFDNVIQPEMPGRSGNNHPIRGNWNKEIFRNGNPVIIELGCGRGEYTIGLATRYPQRNYVGVDIKGARMWLGAKIAHENRIPNTAFLRTRIEFIDSFFSKDEVDEIWLTFPDPHPGKKNSNKRLTCQWFLNKYRSFLKDEGIVHLKTDNCELFNFTKSIAENNNLHVITATTDLHSGNPRDDIISIRTRYEEMFMSEGLKIHYLCFRLPNNKKIE